MTYLQNSNDTKRNLLAVILNLAGLISTITSVMFKIVLGMFDTLSYQCWKKLTLREFSWIPISDSMGSAVRFLEGSGHWLGGKDRTERIKRG